VVGAVRTGGDDDDDAAEHREDGEHGREAGTADTASRRQLFSIVVRRGP
jgi:hypothetical protein